MRRTALFLAIAALTAIVGFSPAAGADPNGPPFNLHCDGVPSGQIVVNGGNGSFTPGFATASTGVYIPYEVQFTATVFDGDGNVLDQFTESAIKRNVPQNMKAHPHGVCSFEETFPAGPPDTFIQFVGTVSVFYTG